MDELVKHCVRELAFEGDLGCDALRLRQFVSNFYSEHISVGQNVDDAYFAFVWSVLVQHPSVTVGTTSSNATGINFPPQTRRKGRKAKDDEDAPQDESVAQLDEVENGRTRSLDDLVEEFGDAVRIAVEPKTCLVFLTGSHARSSKLTPLLYATLQLIARQREQGISVVGIGKTFGCDQKAVFYQVKQLCELDLIVKLRRGGNSQNFCVHKYFYENSPYWKNIRTEEEMGFQEDAQPIASGSGQVETDGADNDTQGFTPIDSRHLTSLNLLRSRIVKLLKQSPNCMHVYENIALKIGYKPQSRTDRRFFLTRLGELFKEGTIEKIFVPNDNPQATSTVVTHIRLVADGAGSVPFTSLQIAEEEKVNQDVSPFEDDEPETGVKTMSTLHRQIVDVLDDAGTKGATLTDISSALGEFDKRTIEHLVLRLEKNLPPPHLADQAVVQLLEFSGREKRYRYYTLKHYLAQREIEQLEDASSYGRADVEAAGGFMDTKPSEFYETQEDLVKFLGHFKSVYWQQTTVKKNGTSKKQFVNPILADGTRKRGRPRKDSNAPPKPKKQKKVAVETGEREPSRGTKRKAVDDLDEDGKPQNVEELVQATQPAKRRGRSPKKRKLENAAASDAGEEPATGVQSTSETLSNAPQVASQNDLSVSAAPKRKRGRPRKNPISAPDNAEDEAQSTTSHRGSVVMNVDHGPEIVTDANDDIVAQVLELVAEAVASVNDVGHTVPAEAGEASPKRSARVKKPSERALAMSENTTGRKGKDKTIPSDPPEPPSQVEQPYSPDTLIQGEHETPQLELRGPLDEGHVDGGREPLSAAAVADTCENTTKEAEKIVESKVSDGREVLPRTGKKNLSHSRRQNELIRVLEQCNGIINTTANYIVDEHAKLVEKMAQAGEPTSCPVGIRLDRKTVKSTLESLEAAGRIKVLNASVPASITPMRMTKIAYLPSVSDEEIQNYLKGLGSSVDEASSALANASGGEATHTDVPQSAAMQWYKQHESSLNHHYWHRNNGRLEEFLKLPTDAIQEALLMERQTASQMLGYIPGKLRRAQALHMHVMGQLSSEAGATSEPPSQNLVVEWDYLTDELPLSLYCAIIPQPVFHVEVKELLDNDEGRETPINKLPLHLKPLIITGKRLQLCAFDLLADLVTLGLVTPMQTSDAKSTVVQYSDKNGQTVNLIPSIQTLASSTSNTPHLFWKFNKCAPVYLVAASNKSPPFFREFDLSTHTARQEFWEALKNASLDSAFANSQEKGSEQVICEYTPRIITNLTRQKHWQTSYHFSWFQEQYLRTYVDSRTYATPCDGPNSEELVQSIADTVHAPCDAVQGFYASFKAEYLRELERKKKKEEAAKKAEERRIETRKFLEGKAEETRKKDIARWDSLVRRYTKSTSSDVQLQRIARLRESYLQSIQKKSSVWEPKIEDILKVTQSAETTDRAQKLFRSKPPRVEIPKAQAEPVPEPRPAPRELQDYVKSIDEIIERQKKAFAGLAEASPVPRKKKKGKSKEEEDDTDLKHGRQRKHRFRWNKEFDELLKDASIIVRARCKMLSRVDWGALDQVFPYIPRNSARQHLTSLKEMPGVEAYLARLQDCWQDLWTKKRGTAELPEAEVITASNFDLKTHIAFLRKHLDKNAIRVGISLEDEKENFELPADIREMEDKWIISERKDGQTTWDFLWNGSAEEGREKQALDEAFVLEIDDAVAPAKDMGYLTVAESAMKMVFGTPKETYDASVASALLHNVGNRAVNEACKSLLADNVLSKLVRDPNKMSPGRALKISEVNQAALGGSMARELFIDAAQLEEAYASGQEDEWHEWPLLSTDGDTAAILQLLSDNMVDIQFDTSNAQVARQTIDYASKKASDSEIEIRMLVKLQQQNFEPSLQPSPIATAMEITNSDSLGHGCNMYMAKASCRLFSEGAVDCQVCIDAAMAAELQSWPLEEQHLVAKLIRIVSTSGNTGISIDAILMKMACPASQCTAILRALSSLAVPLLYVVGYSTTLFISAAHIDAWTVTLGGELDTSPVAKIFPRRWLDVAGNRVREVWDAAVRSIVALVHSRPGICQAEVLWRVRWLFDRQEVLDVLKHLVAEKFFVPKVAEGELPLFEMATPAEERTICWTINHESHWYQIEGV
ncbi:hypothetical protein SCHPADRAFT_816815 [Schizopora paradoxa]|uniref:Uncharacterized protein n=1 Tax=Schizopora paradoxa TaxID=27342 RepID=A0A0H2S6Z7_9AGAM|nr:hypothetical protein SCHPADRAFT_816815 [Schizopora paradoxa]